MVIRHRKAFTLIEVLIVVVIMAILAATIIPQFSDSSDDAKASTLLFNLRTIRSQIQLYKGQHGGQFPNATWTELLSKTTADGTTGAGSYGPYLAEVPMNSVTETDAIVITTKTTLTPNDTTSAGGWFYNVTTGQVWANHPGYIEK